MCSAGNHDSTLRPNLVGSANVLMSGNLPSGYYEEPFRFPGQIRSFRPSCKESPEEPRSKRRKYAHF